MGLNLDEKKAVVAEVSAQLADAQTIVLAEYTGLEVAHLTKLRAQARKSGVYLRVLKNTLVRRAVEGSSFSGLSEQMTGPLIYGISADPVAAAKVLNDFAKTNEKLVLRGGSYAGKVLRPSRRICRTDPLSGRTAGGVYWFRAPSDKPRRMRPPVIGGRA